MSWEAVIRRHLVALPAAIEFDVETGRIDVRPSPDPALAELDPIPLTERPDGFAERVAERGESLAEPPLDPKVVETLLSSAANGLDGGRGAFRPDLARPDTAAERPVVTTAPALVLRRRGRGMLVERLDEIAGRVASSPVLPPATTQGTSFSSSTTVSVPSRGSVSSSSLTASVCAASTTAT